MLALIPWLGSGPALLGQSVLDEITEKASDLLEEGLELPDESRQLIENVVEDASNLLDPRAIDWSQVDPANINWPQIDLSNFDWNQVDLTRIDWAQIDPGRVDWSNVDPSNVDWSRVDVTRVEWDKLDLKQVDWSKVDINQLRSVAGSNEALKFAESFEKLSQMDFEKMFKEQVEGLTAENLAEAGEQFLEDIVVKAAGDWIDSPVGLQIRNGIATNHPYYSQVVAALRFAKQEGIITTREDCERYSMAVAKGIGAYAEKAEGPIVGESLRIFSGDIGLNACKETMGESRMETPPTNASAKTETIPTMPLARSADNSRTVAEEEQWVAGRPHRRWRNVVSSDTRGRWCPAPGYGWNADKTEVYWVPGKAHPENQNCIASDRERIWKAAKAYKVDPRNPTVPHVVLDIIIGVGATFDIDAESGYLQILAVAKRGPVEKAGIRRGIVIRKIDGITTKGRTRSDSVKLLKGEENTEVILELFDPVDSTSRTVRLIRESIPATAFPD